MRRGLTGTDDEEIRDCLRMLISTTIGTGFMHETFYKNNPGDFSPGWFAWANVLFGEWLLNLGAKRPELLQDL